MKSQPRKKDLDTMYTHVRPPPERPTTATKSKVGRGIESGKEEATFPQTRGGAYKLYKRRIMELKRDVKN